MTAAEESGEPARAATASGAEWPLVSVIIPVRNDAARLSVCLQSLGRQNYPTDRFEIIVIDNGSTDSSAEIAVQHGAKLLQCPGLRVGALRNRGVAQACGEILALLDSDHEVPPDWIHCGVEQLLDRSVGAVGSPYLAPPQGTWVQRVWEKHRRRLPGRQSVAWLATGNMFLRRAAFESVGGFAEDLVAAEDVDLCVRLEKHIGAIISDPRVANIHHGEPKTLAAFFWKEYWRGSSGLKSFFSHGMPLHELPSLIYPLYYLLACIGLVVAMGWAIHTSQPIWVVLTVILAALPALLLATKTCWQLRQWLCLPALFVLYLTYGLSRAAALFKR